MSFREYYKEAHGIGDAQLRSPSQELSFLDYYEVPVFVVTDFSNFFILDFAHVYADSPQVVAEGSPCVRYGHSITESADPYGTDPPEKFKWELNGGSWTQVVGDDFGVIGPLIEGENQIRILEFDVEADAYPGLSMARVIRIEYDTGNDPLGAGSHEHTQINVDGLDVLWTYADPQAVDAYSDAGGDNYVIRADESRVDLSGNFLIGPEVPDMIGIAILDSRKFEYFYPPGS